MSSSDVSAAPEAQPLQLADDDELGHLVCCRDPSWLGGVLKAFCGAEEERVMLTAEVVCSMCVEEVYRMRPGFGSDPEGTCPVDGTPCPDDLALAELVARRVLPP